MMNTSKKKITILFICILIAFSNMEIFSLTKDKTIKVGLYSYAPYYYKDKNNNITGYYHDLLDILCEDANIKYEYVSVNMDNAIEKLKNKEIDIVLGKHKLEEKLKDIYYSENYISVDNQCIYIRDMSVPHGDLSYLNGKKFAYIKGDINASFFSKSLKEKNIKMDLVENETLDDCVKMFKNGEVDAISLPVGNNSLKKYNNIYKYSSGIVYIIGNENSKHIIKKFDTIIHEKYNYQYFNKFFNVYIKYFRKEIIIINFFILLFIFLLLLLISYKIVYPFIKKIITRKKIRKNKEQNKFILYYQPIVNPKNNTIVGFESLLRLKDKNNKILSPSFFIKDIQKSDMIGEMTLWILERVIYDYKTISNYDSYKDKEFYISVNLSFEELENEYFVNQMIDMVNKNNLKKGSICLEIVENICINNLDKIKSTIEILKDNGFKIAIDDFGIEYSNLNILEIVAFDIVKLDKYFTDKILKSETSNEVVKFLSNITLITNKSFVIEGVEEGYQVDEIKKISHSSIYIQGYFYCEPLPIEELDKFLINAPN